MPATTACQKHIFHLVTAAEPAVPGEEGAWREVVTEGGCWEGARDAALEKGRGLWGKVIPGRGGHPSRLCSAASEV